MFHCGGGIGMNTFDSAMPLIRWVEQGEAPASLQAARIVNGKTIRTRPLCPWPEVARYKGSGSIDDASNFTCERPQ
jgi:feruloyl esterase